MPFREKKKKKKKRIKKYIILQAYQTLKILNIINFQFFLISGHFWTTQKKNKIIGLFGAEKLAVTAEKIPIFSKGKVFRDNPRSLFPYFRF